MNMMPGVFTAHKKNGDIYYRASITYKSKHISLGSFDTEISANQAYEAAKEVLYSSLLIEDYNTTTPLPFEKWVSLVNVRDNGMYIKNPIYIHKKYFVYYIDSTNHYTFDVDDLFYYSNHKIMKRGNYIFVSDFGMQINILSRYGIKNYAVCGRDYIFKNGDDKDYRYKNIYIINKYYGVFKFTSQGVSKYKAIIHLNSNYVIGTYKTENEAAIAYNKTIDFLKEQGINKDFNTNYVEISAIEYASIYTSIRISKKIRAKFRKK